MTALISDLMQKYNENHPLCGLFCKTKKDTSQLYNHALIEYLELVSSASIAREPGYAKRSLSPSYWHAYDKIYERIEEKDYGVQEVVFLSVAGSGVGIIILISLVLGIKKHLGGGEGDNARLNVEGA